MSLYCIIIIINNFIIILLPAVFYAISSLNRRGGLAIWSWGEVPYCSGAFQRDGEKHLTWLARDQLDILKVSRGSARILRLAISGRFSPDLTRRERRG